MQRSLIGRRERKQSLFATALPQSVAIFQGEPIILLHVVGELQKYGGLLQLDPRRIAIPLNIHEVNLDLPSFAQPLRTL